MSNSIIPIVSSKNGKVFANSCDVAEVFAKRHADVLRALDNLECSDQFTERNYAPSEYRDASGRKLPAFNMTKDGFVFLVMGFTGPKAAQFKEAYINRFNEMEEALRSPPRSNAFGLNEVREFSFDGHRLRAVATEVGPRVVVPCMAGPEWTTAA